MRCVLETLDGKEGSSALTLISIFTHSSLLPRSHLHLQLLLLPHTSPGPHPTFPRPLFAPPAPSPRRTFPLPSPPNLKTDHPLPLLRLQRALLRRPLRRPLVLDPTRPKAPPPPSPTRGDRPPAYNVVPLAREHHLASSCCIGDFSRHGGQAGHQLCAVLEG